MVRPWRSFGARGKGDITTGSGKVDDLTIKMEHSAHRFVLALFLVEVLLAGGSGLAIRFSNRELAPLWGSGLRFFISALIVLAIMVGLKLALPRGKALVGAVLFGILQFAGTFGLYQYALVEVQAGLGQTLLALVPLATLVLAVVQGQERLRPASVAGVLLGLIGVGIISSGALRGNAPLPSLLAILGSVLCFAQSLVLIRRLPPIHPVTLNAIGMSVAAPILFAVSSLVGETWALPQRGETWIALAYISVIGSVTVFLLHVYVVRNWGAARSAYMMVLIPIVTVLLSARLDHEPISPQLVFGGLLVGTGVYIGALRVARAR